MDRLIIPRADRGVLVFVGWGRLGRILLLGLVAPLAAYAMYLGAAAGLGGQTGLTLSGLGRIVVELAALGAIIFGLVARLSRSAIRQRAAEIGLTVPPPSTWRAARSCGA